MTAAVDRGRLAAWSALVLALATLGYATRASEGKPDQDFLFKYSTAVGGAIQYGDHPRDRPGDRRLAPRPVRAPPAE